MSPDVTNRGFRPENIAPRSALKWKIVRRDIYDEEGYEVKSISVSAPHDAPWHAWHLCGHWTRDELVCLREALSGL